MAASIESVQAAEELEIDLLLEGVFRRFGYDFRDYQRAPVRRKLHGLMQDYGLRTVSALQERVLHDQAASDVLLQALAARPAGLFDEPAHVLTLRQVLGPWLRSCPAPKVWVAECASAEEACTLAILLEEEQIYDKARIFATVANENVLRQARQGSFARERLDEYEENYRRSGGKRKLADYCVADGERMHFLPQLMNNITWAQYNLATDASFNEFELIVCRRTLADFGPALRRRALQLFHDSLALFGLLSVDEDSECNSTHFAACFKAICADNGVYKRIA